MTGVPVTRLPSPDGRWDYTLYQSAEHPFVHALDTQRRTAVCIDLDDLDEVWNATLACAAPPGCGGPPARVLAASTRAPTACSAPTELRPPPHGRRRHELAALWPRPQRCSCCSFTS